MQSESLLGSYLRSIQELRKTLRRRRKARQGRAIPGGRLEALEPRVLLNGQMDVFIWNDANGNGVQDGGESGLAGVTVDLVEEGNPGNTQQVSSDGNGIASFLNVVEGSYLVQVQAQLGKIFTYQDVHENTQDAFDSDVNALGQTGPIFLPNGAFNNTLAAGLVDPGTISGQVFDDHDGNGAPTTGEPGLPNVQVYLDNNLNGVFDTGVERETSSDSEGYFSFDNLLPGQYVVRQTAPADYAQTAPSGAAFHLASRPASLPPSDVVAADFDNDANLDVIYRSDDGLYLSAPDNDLRVIIGDFSGAARGLLQAADFDNNGSMDLLAVAVDGLGNPEVRFYINNGTGLVASSGPLTGRNFQSPVVGDFNNDELPDLAVLDAGSGQILIYGNLGSDVGGFLGMQLVQTLNASPRTQFLSVGDSNGDGIADVLVAASPSDEINNAGLELFTSTLAGVFSGGPVVDLGAGVSPTAPAVVLDLDGNGEFDLAVPIATSGDSGILIVRQFQGDFQLDSNLAGPANVDLLLAGDFDGNGDVDLVAGDGSSLSLLVSYGGGLFSNTFAGQQGVADNTRQYVSAVVVDANQDGELDLVVSNNAALQQELSTFTSVQGAYSVYIDPNSSFIVDFGNHRTVAAAGTISGIAFSDDNNNGVLDYGEAAHVGATVFADVNRDGVLDGGDVSAVTGSDGYYEITGLAAGSYVVLLDPLAGQIQTLPGEFSFPAVTTITDLDPGSLATGDYTGDGINDVVVVTAGEGGNNPAVWLLAGLGMGSFAAPVDLGFSDASQVLLGDLNGDGADDLLVGKQTLDRFVIQLSTSSTPDQTLTVSAAQQAALGDFNNDGLPDLAVADTLGDTLYVYLNLGTSGPNWLGLDNPMSFDFSVGDNGGPLAPAVGDFNNDTIDDLVVPLATGGAVLLRASNDANLLVLDSLREPGANIAQAYVADISGDGLNDVLLLRNNENKIITFVSKAGGAFNDPLTTYPPLDSFSGQPVATNMRSLRVADLNGDGQPEMIVVGNEGIRAFGLSGSMNQHLAEGSGFDGLALADLNGDALPDLLSVHSATEAALNFVQAQVNLPFAHLGLVSGQSGSVDLNFATVTPGSISGVVFADNNVNGVFDGGDTPLEGLTVFFDGDYNSQLDPGEDSVLTAIDGSFQFNDVYPGQHHLALTGLAAGFVVDSAFDSNFISVESGAGSTMDIPVLELASVSGVVFQDNNADGLQGGGELGQEGWLIFADANHNAVFDDFDPYTVSNDTGAYQLSGLTPGQQRIHMLTQTRLTTLVRYDSGNLQEPTGLAFSPDGDLYVSNYGNEQVLHFDGQSGQFLGAFASSPNPGAMIFGSNGDLYVTDIGNNQILRYSPNGTPMGSFVTAGSGGLSGVRGMAFGNDGFLYVVSGATNQVLRYDGDTGAFVDAFINGADGLSSPFGLAFSPQGDLFVSNLNSNAILQFSSFDGVQIAEFVSGGGSSSLLFPKQIAFGPDGRLYVASAGTDAVLSFDGYSGDFTGAVIPSGALGLSHPISLAIDSGGRVVTAGQYSNNIIRQESGLDFTQSPAAPSARDLVLTPGALQTGENFANVPLGHVKGLVFFDVNGDSTRQGTEPGQQGWTVYADINSSGTFDSTTSNFATGQSTPLAGYGNVASRIDVTAMGPISKVVVNLDITQDLNRDITIALVSPDGQVVQLFDDPGSNGGNFTSTTFDDDAANSIFSGAAPYSGSFQPIGALSQFYGARAQGPWFLVVQNNGGEGGVINSWSLDLTIDEPNAVTYEGDYDLSLIPGSYQIREDVQSGWTQTLPSPAHYDVEVTPGAALSGFDFGNFQSVATGSISGMAFADLNGNGIRDIGDDGVAGIEVRIFDYRGYQLDSVITDANGLYQYNNLLEGTYEIQFVTEDYFFSPQHQGGDTGIDSDADVQSGVVGLAVTAGAALSNVDAGLQLGASLGDYVLVDGNANGIQDEFDRGLSGALVELYSAGIDGQIGGGDDQLLEQRVSDSGGFYSFGRLTPGNYFLHFEAPAGFFFSPTGQGGDVALDSDADTGSGNSPVLSLNAGDYRSDLDALLYQQVSVGDFVWNDLDGNGIQNDGEPGLDNVTVELLDENETVLATTSTAGGGFFNFSNQTPGFYSLRFANPEGMVATAFQDGYFTEDSDIHANGQTPLFLLDSGEQDFSRDAGFVVPITLRGNVYHDRAANGQPDEGDEGRAGVTLFLDYNGNGEHDGIEPSTTTDGLGNYEFTGLPPEEYLVLLLPSGGFQQSTPNELVYFIRDLDAQGGAGAVHAADFTGDLLPDLLLQQDGGVSLLVRDGNFFSDPISILSADLSAAVNPLALGDINNDGYSDVIVADGSTVHVLLNDGSGSGSFTLHSTIVGSYTSPVIANVGSSEFPDLFLLDPSGSNVEHFLNDGVAGEIFQGFAPYTTYSVVGQLGDSLSAADIDADGSTDLALISPLVGPTHDEAVLLLNDGLGAFTFNRVTLPDNFSAQSNIAVGDLNQDGFNDLVIAGMLNTSNGVQVMLGSGNGSFSTGTFSNHPAAAGNQILLTDLDGDGQSDLLLAGGDTVLAMIGLGNGGFDDALILDGELGALFDDYTHLSISDLNGDGRLDIAASDDQEFSQVVLLLDATGGHVVDAETPGDTVSGLDFGGYQFVTVQGRVFDDLNGNGFYDGTDVGLVDQEVSLQGYDAVISDSEGLYSFTEVAPGNHLVSWSLPGGRLQSTPLSVSSTLASGDVLNADFGSAVPVSISGVVFDDVDGNGLFDGSDTGIAGETVILDDGPSAVTDGNGQYSFIDVLPGTRFLDYTPSSGLAATSQTNVELNTLSGESPEVNFGTTQVITVEGAIFNDQDNNGFFDFLESGLDSVTVTLTDLVRGGSIQTVTDSQGFFSLQPALPGDYRLDYVSQGDDLHLAQPIDLILDSGAVVTEQNLGMVFPAAISGMVYEDRNGNGQFDIGEPAVAGATIFDDLNQSGVLDGGELSAVSDAAGLYLLGGLIPGDHVFGQLLPGGFQPLNPAGSLETAVRGDEVLADQDFGDYRPASISGVIFDDLNGNGLKETGENGLSSQSVSLQFGLDEPVNALVDGNGLFTFNNLRPGSYHVLLTTAGGRSATSSDDVLVDLESNQAASGVAFGTVAPASVQGRVFVDDNADGILNNGEGGVENVAVDLTDVDHGGSVSTVFTDVTGHYSFAPALPGNYRVDYQVQANDLDLAGPVNLILESGEIVSDVDFGIVAPASISGNVFEDVNGDDIYGGGELPRSNVRVYADMTANGVFDAGEPTAFSDGDGFYTIVDLVPGDYDLRQVVTDPFLDGSGVQRVIITTAGEDAVGPDFGSYRPVTISGVKFSDDNGNGARDSGSTSGGGGDAGLEEDIIPGPVGTAVLGFVDDDSFGPQNLGFDFQFFGQTFSSIYINNNGNVTFTEALSAFDPLGFPQAMPVIAPFWADVDNGAGFTGDGVYFSSGTTTGGHEFARVDWFNVGYDDVHNDLTNTFTLYFQDDAAGDLVAFVYGNMQWTTGDSSGGVNGFGGSGAQVGFDSGDGTNFLSLARPDSANAVAALSNTAQVFRTGSGAPQTTPPEAGLVDWSIYLDQDGDSTLDQGEVVAITGAGGSYSFEGLAPGHYVVREVQQPGWTTTAPVSGSFVLDLSSGDAFTTADFGNTPPVEMGDITGKVFNDADASGSITTGDTLIVEALVYLDLNGSATYDNGEPHAFTDGDGLFAFTGIAPDDYTLRQDLPVGWEITKPAAGFYLVTVVDGGVSSGHEFGNHQLVTPAPTTPDLLVSFDSGGSNSDNLTRFNNLGAGNALQFSVSNTVAGAIVELFADGLLIGSAVASGTQTTITTDGTTDLSDGAHSITAMQTHRGVDSTVSAALNVVIDATAPTALIAPVSPDPRESGVSAIAFQFDEAVFGLTTSALSLTRDGGSNLISGVMSLTSNDSISWSISGLSAATNPNGSYQFTLVGIGIRDAAGNSFVPGVSDSWVRGNSAPVVSLAGNNLSYSENDAAPTLDSAALVSDDGSANFSGGSMTVSFSANGTANDRLFIRHQGTAAGDVGAVNGTLSIGGVVVGSYSGGDSGSTPLVINFNGAATPAHAQAILRRVTYTNVSEAPISSTRTVSVTVSDGAGGSSSPATRNIVVTAINDAPTLTAPSTQATDVTQALTFSTGNGNAITFADVDAGSAALRLSLTANGGMLTLASLGGLTFVSGDGSEDQSITATGSLSDLSAALQGLVYRPTGTSAGTGTLQVVIDDQGNSGAGGALTASRTVTISLSASQSQTGVVSGRKFLDSDGNGVMDTGENGLAAFAIYADLNSNGVFDSGEPRTSSDANGFYSLTLNPGDYLIREVNQQGYAATAPASGSYSVTVVTGQTVSDRNFGNAAAAGITGLVFFDLNGDGVRQSSESGLGGVTVYIDSNNNNALDSGERSTTSSNTGGYRFESLAPGSYVVRQQLPDGYTATSPAGSAYNITLRSGQTATDRSFGNTRSGSISGVKFLDSNGNGILDSGETGLSGFTIYLDRNKNGALDVGEDSTSSDGNGLYSFTVLPGSYVVREEQQPGYTATSPAGGGYVVSLLADAAVTARNFGNASFGAISGQQFVDDNQDGIKQGGESGFADVTVFLDGNNNGKLDSGERATSTGATGAYSFANVTPGSYVLRQLVPVGYVQTLPSGSYSVTVNSGDDITGKDFGDRLSEQRFSISGSAFHDVNGDGLRAAALSLVRNVPSETGLAGVTVFLDSDRDGVQDGGEASTITGADGSFTFTNLAPGNYHVVQLAAGGDFTQSPGTAPGLDVALTSGNAGGVHFGNYHPAALYGTAFMDHNRNGLRNGRDEGLDGITVYLDANDNGVLDGGEESTVSNALGEYHFSNLAPGNHKLATVAPEGFFITFPRDRSSQQVTLNSGPGKEGINFGFFSAPNLTGSFTSIGINSTFVPGDSGTAVFNLANDGNGRFATRANIDFFLATDEDLANNVGSSVLHFLRSITLNPGDAADLAVSFTIPNDLSPGSYHLVASIDPANQIEEVSENDNLIVSDETFVSALLFGNIAEDDNLRLTADGISFQLTGPGVGRVVPTENDSYDVIISGSDATTVVKITAARGQTARLNDVHVDGALKTFDAPAADLLGSMDVAGSIAGLRLRNVADDHRISIGPAASATLAATIVLNNVAELSLQSQTPIYSLTVRQWLDEDGIPDVISAPVLLTLTSTGDFQAGLLLTGLGEGLTPAGGQILRTATIGGSLSQADWSLAGNLGTLRVSGNVSGLDLAVDGGVASFLGNNITDSSLDAQGVITNLTVARWANGTIAGSSIANFRVAGNARAGIAGDLENVQLLASNDSALVSLGTVQVAGKIVGSAIRSAAGIARVTAGAMVDSQLFAGVDSQVTSLPGDASAFVNENAVIGQLTLTSTSLEQPSLVNSAIAAFRIGKATIKRVQTDNGETPFGFAARRIDLLTLLNSSNRTIRLANLDQVGESVAEGDFRADVLIPEEGG